MILASWKVNVNFKVEIIQLITVSLAYSGAKIIKNQPVTLPLDLTGDFAQKKKKTTSTKLLLNTNDSARSCLPGNIPVAVWHCKHDGVWPKFLAHGAVWFDLEF